MNLAIILKGVGLPMEGIALIAGVDVAIDMFRTSANVIGRACDTLVVATKEKMLNRDILYGWNELSTDEVSLQERSASKR